LAKYTEDVARLIAMHACE